MCSDLAWMLVFVALLHVFVAGLLLGRRLGKD
jgi:K+-transporting ATPase A subunit